MNTGAVAAAATEGGPGVISFLAFFALAVALWFLMRNMNARMRRMSYRQQQAGRGKNDPQASPDDPQDDPADPAGSLGTGGSSPPRPDDDRPPRG
ncbi:MAG: hypothetical protein ACRCXL_03770 [Dermatophilaceae bacterium]